MTELKKHWFLVWSRMETSDVYMGCGRTMYEVDKLVREASFASPSSVAIIKSGYYTDAQLARAIINA